MIDASARGAWHELDAKLRPFIARRVQCKADADDITQEVLLRMQRGIAQLRDDQRFGAWVYQIARNAIVDHQRAQAKHLVVEDPGGEDEAFEGDDPDATAMQELAGYVAAFVAILPSPYREALTLVELQGMTQKQAAEMLGISVSGMKSRVQRGRIILRKALEECCHIALDARQRVVSYAPRPDGRLPEGCCAGDCSAHAAEAQANKL